MGFPSPGEEREFLAIDHLRVTASWHGTTPDRETKISQFTPPRGWVVLETRVHVHSSSNGSRSTRVVEGGFEVLSEEEVKDFYKEKIELAYKDKDMDLVARLETERDKHLRNYRHFKTNKNLVEAEVTAKAHGSPADRKRGWEEISVYVKCMYIGLPYANSLSISSNRQLTSVKQQTKRNSSSLQFYAPSKKRTRVNSDNSLNQSTHRIERKI